MLAVPVGFETDLASVPSVLSGVFHPEGYWAKAAVIHDFLYKTAMVERVMADLIFLEAMQVLNVSRPIRLGFFFAVRLFGRRAYQRAKLAAMDLALEPARKQNGVFDDAAN